MENQNIIIQTEFQGIILNVKLDDKHEWLLSTEEVAKGYKTTPEVLRFHKKHNAEELVINKHFTSVSISHAGLKRVKTYWTKRGIIRLGFFIKSENAKLFRDWAEDLIINHLEQKETSLEVIKNELKQELKNEIHKTQTELIHNLKQHFLEIMEAQTKQNNKALVWQFWQYLNLIQGKLEERIKKLEPPKLEDLDDWDAYVYLMKKKNTTRHKIGKSGTPNTRRQNIQSNSGDEIELVLTIKMPNATTASALESYLKEFFKDKKIRGEWYNLNENDVMMIKMIAQSFEMYFANHQ